MMFAPPPQTVITTRPLGHACDCGRKFANAQGLATHKTRAHKKAS